MPGLAEEIEELKTFAVAGSLPSALGGALGTATIRTVPEDFVVTEEAGLNFSDEGEFLYDFYEPLTLSIPRSHLHPKSPLFRKEE